MFDCVLFSLKAFFKQDNRTELISTAMTCAFRALCIFIQIMELDFYYSFFLFAALSIMSLVECKIMLFLSSQIIPIKLDESNQLIDK